MKIEGNFNSLYQGNLNDANHNVFDLDIDLQTVNFQHDPVGSPTVGCPQTTVCSGSCACTNTCNSCTC